jgi:hypothetical protein
MGPDNSKRGLNASTTVEKPADSTCMSPDLSRTPAYQLWRIDPNSINSRGPWKLNANLMNEPG